MTRLGKDDHRAVPDLSGIHSSYPGARRSLLSRLRARDPSPPVDRRGHPDAPSIRYPVTMTFPERNEAGEAIVTTPLYHYASVEALKGIIETGTFRATHAYYMSDATEIDYGLGGIKRCADERHVPKRDPDHEILDQIARWITSDLTKTPRQIFVICLSTKRDDLNQWRSYTLRTGGVCIVFDPAALFRQASPQGWEWANCKYQEDQKTFGDRVIDSLLEHARAAGPSPARVAPERQSYFPVFRALTGEVLRIACRIKHPKFSEEYEWRVISPYIERNDDKRIGYRTAGSLLVPYANFELGDLRSNGVIEGVYVGPTAHADLSHGSVAAFLGSKRIPYFVRRSDVPYRAL